jgi:hypothetical protein
MGPVSEIIAAHPNLVTKLRRFSHSTAIPLGAALSLFPEFHAQTIRLEILQHLIAVCCTGRRIAERDDLAEWAGKYMGNSPYARQEDPVEDVFVGSVNSSFGSFRLPMGIFADADFWVERLLHFLSGKQNFPPFEIAVAHVLPLLKLSDALLARVGLKRYTRGSGDRGAKIIVPRWKELESQTMAVIFSDTDLAQIGLTRRELDEFIFTEEDRNKLINENVWNSTLERRPLVELANGIAVAMPSSLSRSALRYLVEIITRSMGGWADTFYKTENASIFVNDVASRLGITPIQFDEPKRPEKLPSLLPFFGQFDVGKAAILLTYCPSILDAAADFGGCDQLSEEEDAALDAYLRECATAFERLPGFSGGMVLISIAGGLRMNLFGVKEWSPQWRIFACTLPDWLFITSHGECSALRLWKLGDHKAALTHNGTKTLNLAGLPNLFSVWKSNGFRLLPQSQDPRGLTMIHLDCVFAVDLRFQSRQREDVHCVRSHAGGSWIKLRRYNSKPLFAEDVTLQMYFALEGINEGRLAGCLKESSTLWWTVFYAIGTTREHKSLAFKLWECVFHWVTKTAPIAQRQWPVLLQYPSIEILLDLPDFEKWRTDDNNVTPLESAELLVGSDPEQRRITLTMPESFLAEFHTPKNTAEQRVVECLLNSIAKLAGTPLDEERKTQMVREIVGNDDARYFHVVRARRIEQHFANPGHPDPLFIADEDFAFSRLGLAHLFDDLDKEEILGLADCKEFLKNAVSKVWERAEDKLKRFERKSVILHCLHQLDEISRDEERWDMSTRSTFALHRDASNVHEVLLEMRSKREQASMCNRLLIETAQYACNDGIDIFTQADHLTILADIALLITLAHHRDAVAYGFIEPKLRLFPNGEIDVADEKFYAGVWRQYTTKRSQERNEAAAADYEDFFPPDSQSPDDDKIDSRLQEFDKTFVPEFGFSIDLIFNLLGKFKDFALYAEQSHGELGEVEMRAFLEHCEFSPAATDAFLDRFTLPIRNAWNSDLPELCREQDVFPWRFRRQLSLLYRPLIQTSANPRSWLLSVPIFEKSVSYRLGHIERAAFPKEFFLSPEMHRYIGNTVNKAGHQFAARVNILVSKCGYRSQMEIEMTQLGAPKKEGLGDIDVLAWNVDSGIVLAIECKRLTPAITVREVIQRLEDFRGNRAEKDSLGRHLRRLDWLTKHLDALAKHTKISVANIRLVPLLVTSETVPMQFFAEMNFSVSNVIPHDELENYLITKLSHNHKAAK